MIIYCQKCKKELKDWSEGGPLMINGHADCYSIPYSYTYYFCSDCWCEVHRAINNALIEQLVEPNQHPIDMDDFQRG